MAVKVSDLTTESAPASTDLLLIADPSTGVAKKITVSALKTFMDGLGGGGDLTAPVVVTATATTANTIVIVFSESVTVTTAGWSFKINGANWPISSLSGSGSTWTFTMTTSGADTDTILRSYNSATGVTVDTAANELASFTDSSVTNDIPEGGSYDSDAQAFFTAAGITDSTQKTAVNNLVLALKAASIWTKVKALYPFVGGDATKHSYNLKTPASFQITWGGSPTHNANGVTGNATDAYGETGFFPSTDLASNLSMCVFGYNRANVADAICNTYGSGYGQTTIVPKFSGNFYGAIGASQTVQVSDTNSDATGRYIVTRTGASVLKAFKNGTQISSTATGTPELGSATSVSVTILCDKISGSRSAYSNINLATFGFSDGLDDTEVGDLDDAISAFNTALSR